jgi:hypothetical protein
MQNYFNEIGLSLPQIVSYCRTGDYGNAARELNKCIIYFQQIQKSNLLKNISKEYISKLNYSLETILMMLSNKDWVAVADIIQYELIDIWEQIKTQTLCLMQDGLHQK